MAVISVNAAADTRQGIDATRLQPTIEETLNAVTNIQLHRYNTDTLQDMQQSLARWTQVLSTPQRPVQTYFVRLSFDDVPDAAVAPLPERNPHQPGPERRAGGPAHRRRACSCCAATPSSSGLVASLDGQLAPRRLRRTQHLPPARRAEGRLPAFRRSAAPRPSALGPATAPAAAPWRWWWRCRPARWRGCSAARRRSRRLPATRSL